MGLFTVPLDLMASGNQGEVITLSEVIVDTGSEKTWLPEEALYPNGLSLRGHC